MRAKLDALASIRPATGRPEGGFVTLDGADHYRIAGVQGMAPFLMSIPSATDLWMYVTSRGGLTAGRVDAESSLFPYLTVDRLHDAHHHTGPVTLVRVAGDGGATVVWEPFAAVSDTDPGLERNLYKSAGGQRVVFEEIHHGLRLAFRYAWAACDQFGWIRSASLENRGDRARRCDLLDGLRNVLPHGAPLSLHQQASNLVDAYKTSEIDAATGLGIFSLTAGITDRAEALESLRANTVWCCGLEGVRHHLSADAVGAFRAGRVVPEDAALHGKRGNYLVSTSLELEAGSAERWHLVCDTGRDHLDVSRLRREAARGAECAPVLEMALDEAAEELRANVASADGLQLTGHREIHTHHFANVLFNNMRGGVFLRNHQVPGADFADFVRTRNREVADRHAGWLEGLPESLPCDRLRTLATETADADLERLAHEYLPLHFGRRHGDPSRPWNRFEIRVHGPDGERELNYEGNWRDIFQNWEALCTSFPGFLPHVVAKFVNASTVDGHNPYRLTRDGVDWEVPDPEDPWANIGYWGDHQIIYLLKLLEQLRDHDPEALGRMMGRRIFSYAEVPYRIRPYTDLVSDPRETIDFDHFLDRAIAERVAETGSDGRLLRDGNGGVHHVNLFEKLLVPALAKLSNLVPGAGIWMNTQRPEWNDANNALAGGAVSVVTLCYLRRYLAFMADLLDATDGDLPLSRPVAAWLDRIAEILAAEQETLTGGDAGDAQRRRVMDELGQAFGAYRARVYESGLDGTTGVATAAVAEFLSLALAGVEASIAANRRDDGLVHTYNLLDVSSPGAAVVGRLPVMLEGQVAALSSGSFTPAAGLQILASLFASPLYREDQRSFLLYPARELPGFLDRNAVPAEDAERIPLVARLNDMGVTSLLARDADGTYRFGGDLRNADDVASVLDRLAEEAGLAAEIERDRGAVLALFEQVFDHDSYTGRSGVMYGYEGNGCIYWHMVAKLLLATQELAGRAEREGAAEDVRAELERMYYRVRAGIGYERSVDEYGAFPTDPYSHTPADGAARQPGMTGQVKEEILTRFGELGVRVRNGRVEYRPTLLRANEFLVRDGEFAYVDTTGKRRTIPVAAGSLAFTHCQVPVVYRRTGEAAFISVSFADGTVIERTGDRLDRAVSAGILARSGTVERITVSVPEAAVVEDGPA